MAVAPRGCLLHAPDMYMKKIAVVKDWGSIGINTTVENLRNIAKALNKDISDLTVDYFWIGLGMRNS